VSYPRGARGNPVERFLGKIKPNRKTRCWEWQGAATSEYGAFGPRAGKTVRAPRYAYLLFNGIEPPRRLYVCHTCDNPRCVNPRHLFVGTAHDNSVDMYRKGRRTVALSRTLERAARRLWRTGRYTQRQLAARFGVSQWKIWRLASCT